MLDESLSSTKIAAVEQALNDAVASVENCTGTVEISGMQDLTSQLSSGLSVKIYGPDADTITALGDKVVQMVNDTEGFANAATGKTRMRPILMTTLTTVLAMLQMVFSNDMASQLMSGMAIVIICGLSYATLMTLYIVPILYDILFKKPPLVVDVGDDGMDDIPDDAAEYIAQSNAAAAQPAQPET